MRQNFRKPTETEYELVGKFVKETGIIKKKLYTYTALVAAVLIAFPCFWGFFLIWVSERSIGEILLCITIGIAVLIIIFGMWALYMRQISVIKMNYEEGNFSVCPVTITEREKSTWKRGLLYDMEEDYSEGRNRFYLSGTDSSGVQSTFRVSGKEYEKSKTKKQALAVFWDGEGFYGNCDLLIK